MTGKEDERGSCRMSRPKKMKEQVIVKGEGGYLESMGDGQEVLL
jgi:hypothetical protein